MLLNLNIVFWGQSPCNINSQGRVMEGKGGLTSMLCPKGRHYVWLPPSQGCDEGGFCLMLQWEAGIWHIGMKFHCELDPNRLSLSNILLVIKLFLNRKLLEDWIHIQFQVGMVLNTCNGYSSGCVLPTGTFSVLLPVLRQATSILQCDAWVNTQPFFLKRGLGL